MFLYPALAAGFLFVGVPLLVHLINLLRHRRTKWAAMEFLLASYRKQRRWIVLRQVLLLLSRIAVAALLIAVLAGLIGGKRLISAIGGQTTHHVIVLDDSYSMRQRVDGGADGTEVAGDAGRETNAYDRALVAINSLVRRLGAEEGVHQLTVMRASRAAVLNRSKSGSADAAADIAAQTITDDARQIERLMSTRASTLRTDLVPALDLAGDLLNANPSDERRLYVISDFSRRDWQSPRRLAASLDKAKKSGAAIRMIDCVENAAAAPPRNLAITDLAPEPDVWVAGVPVMVNVTVKNYSVAEVKNVALSAAVITYGDDVKVLDSTSSLSGQMQSLPAIMIESIPAGQQLTKTFQIYIDRPGTHVVRVGLPEDALAIDNTRSCTIPLADAQRVLIVDGDAEGLGAYHVSSVLDPGSQVRLGAIPEVRPPAMLRDASLDTLKRYRAIYLIDLPEISDRLAQTLQQYVRDGGGLAWFLGDDVTSENYNRVLAENGRRLLPFELERVPASEESPQLGDESKNASASPGGGIVFGKDGDLLGPISRAGNGVFGLVNMRRAWVPVENADAAIPKSAAENDPATGQSQANGDAESPVVASDPLDTRVLIASANGQPIAVRHGLGRGRVVTVMSGLDGTWNNWPGDPSFVVFLLQTNAMLFSGAAPPTSRLIDEPAVLPVPGDSYLPIATLMLPANEPPRLSIELEADNQSPVIEVSPTEMLIADEAGLDDFLLPGVDEWQRTGVDGQTSVLPMAAGLRLGESDLASMPHAELLRDLPGLGIEFVSATTWKDDPNVGGMSTFLLVLLGLLALLLAIEQALAAWASYHVKRSSPDHSSRSLVRRTALQSDANSGNESRPRSRSRHRRVNTSASAQDTGTAEVTR